MIKENIIDRHISEDKTKLNITNCILELDARIKSLSIILEEIKEALQGFSVITIEMNERLNKLSPKIDIVSEAEARSLIGPTKL